jgi:DNA helicase HerA-like ATPase
MEGPESKYFTDFDGRFVARLSSVSAVRRTEAPSETTGISARYECRIKVEYQRDLMGLLEEGMLLAVRNFKAQRHGGKRFTLLEISRIGPEHYGLKGLSDYAYYPFQFEVIQQSVEDWDTDDKATMMIQLSAIPLNYDLIIDDGGGISYEKGFTHPVIAERVLLLNKDTIHQMYNKAILERMGKPWQRIETSRIARADPRIGVIKMFESEGDRIPIYVDYERLIRYHFGIFGFTGCGKSNLLANIIRRIVYHLKDAKVVIFDISMEYPFLLQDVFSDPSVPSKIVLESPIENADQVFKIIVKPKRFEKDSASMEVFDRVLEQEKMASYAEPADRVPTYEDLLKDIEALRRDSANKPNYLDALDEIRRSILEYIKANDLKGHMEIDGAFVSHLDRVSRNAVEEFNVSDKSNLYGWATSRHKLAKKLASAPPEAGDGYTIDALAGLLESDLRLLCLSIADPNLIKEMAISLTSRALAGRKREFRVEPLTLFVFDEAQEFIPAYDRAKGIEGSCTEAVETLLRQGRKYGLGGCIATQRIAYLNTNALQQLHTYFVGPLPRPYDRNLVSSTFAIDQAILEKTLEFAPGEWLLSSYVATGMEDVPIFIKADDAEGEIEEFLRRHGGAS